MRATGNLLLHRSVFERKGNPDRDLPVLDGTALNLPARLKHLEPAHASHCFRRPGDRSTDRIIARHFRRAGKAYVLIDVLRHDILSLGAGLPHEAVPVSKLESGAVRCLAFDVHFGSEADIRSCIGDVRPTPTSGHAAQCTARNQCATTRIADVRSLWQLAAGRMEVRRATSLDLSPQCFAGWP